MKDLSGMILGGDTKPAQPLYVGVGDTAARLMTRNPYLKQCKLSAKKRVAPAPADKTGRKL